jgi:Domain of unknown function (DUF4314)
MNNEQAAERPGQEATAGPGEEATGGQERGKDDGAMTSCQPGDRVALVRTGDPDTRLRPGDQGTVTRWHQEQGQLLIDLDSGSRLIMLPGEGDEVRLASRPAAGDGTAPERPHGDLAARPPARPEGGHPISATQPPAPGEATPRQAEVIGRHHGRAAVHWQIGDSGTSEALAFYQELLRGIAEGDPEITGPYQVPDLTVRRDTSGH